MDEETQSHVSEVSEQQTRAPKNELSYAVAFVSLRDDLVRHEFTPGRLREPLLNRREPLLSR